MPVSMQPFKTSGQVSFNNIFKDHIFRKTFGYAVITCSTTYASEWLHLRCYNDTNSCIIRKIPLFFGFIKNSEYDQEIPQSQTADNPVAPRGRAAQPSQDTRKTN